MRHFFSLEQRFECGEQLLVGDAGRRFPAPEPRAISSVYVERVRAGEGIDVFIYSARRMLMNFERIGSMLKLEMTLFAPRVEREYLADRVTRLRSGRRAPKNLVDRHQRDARGSGDVLRRADLGVEKPAQQVGEGVGLKRHLRYSFGTHNLYLSRRKVKLNIRSGAVGRDADFVSPRCRISITLLFVLLIACESDEKKYERLQSELYAAEAPLRIADRAAAKGEPQCPELKNLPTNTYLDSCSTKLSNARTKSALLQRELNQFMSGR